jgi:hypothetical protein
MTFAAAVASRARERPVTRTASTTARDDIAARPVQAKLASVTFTA